MNGIHTSSGYSPGVYGSVKTSLFKPKYYRYFTVGDDVSARCSEGVVYRGKVTSTTPAQDLVTILFDDGDTCDVRRTDVRLNFHRNTVATLNFPSNFDPTSTFTTKSVTSYCVKCNVPVEPEINLPQYIIKKTKATPKTKNDLKNIPVLTCFMCGDSYHKGCYKGEIIEHDMTPWMRKSKSGAGFEMKKTIPENHKILFGWKCRFCIIQIYTEFVQQPLAEKDLTALMSEIPQNLTLEITAVRKSLDYNIEKLQWNKSRKKNENEIYCYCGATGDWWYRMIQCCMCRQWFHENCLNRDENREKLLCGDLFFLLYCSVCMHSMDLQMKNSIHGDLRNGDSKNGDPKNGLQNGVLSTINSTIKTETIIRVKMSLLQAVHLILYNIHVMNQASQEFAVNKYFDFELTALMSREEKKANSLTLIWPQCLKKITSLPLPENVKKLGQAKLRRCILEEVLYPNPHIFEKLDGDGRNAWRLKNPNKTPSPDKASLAEARERYVTTNKENVKRNCGNLSLNKHDSILNGHANGRANGNKNGHTNGHTNGHANGHTNGHTNGHINGLVNRIKNGHSNGYANGNLDETINCDSSQTSSQDVSLESSSPKKRIKKETATNKIEEKVKPAAKTTKRCSTKRECTKSESNSKSKETKLDKKSNVSGSNSSKNKAKSSRQSSRNSVSSENSKKEAVNLSSRKNSETQQNSRASSKRGSVVSKQNSVSSETPVRQSSMANSTSDSLVQKSESRKNLDEEISSQAFISNHSISDSEASTFDLMQMEVEVEFLKEKKSLMNDGKILDKWIADDHLPRVIENTTFVMPMSVISRDEDDYKKSRTGNSVNGENGDNNGEDESVGDMSFHSDHDNILVQVAEI